MWWQKQFFLSALLCLLAGGAILVYRGPGWTFWRYYVGDVVAVAFVYFGLSFFWAGALPVRVGLVAAVAVMVEVFQGLHLMPKDASPVVQVLLGSSFDWGDFLAYGVGLAGAVAVDVWLFKKSVLPEDK